MSELFVKICGITNVEDARTAANAVASAVGFVFVPNTPRCITIDQAREIAGDIPAHVKKVGVFVGEAPKKLNAVAHEVPLDLVQVHCELSAKAAAELAVPYIKVERVRGEIDLARLTAYNATAYLFDTYVENALGGTGRTFDWTLALPAVAAGLPVMLSGGLTPENVGEAVRLVRPYGVDVSSGVEASPGRKDPEKVRAFIANAKGAFRD